MTMKNALITVIIILISSVIYLAYQNVKCKNDYEVLSVACVDSTYDVKKGDGIVCQIDGHSPNREGVVLRQTPTMLFFSGEFTARVNAISCSKILE